MAPDTVHMDTIRFSVIIPAYNASNTIAAAIDSCLCQSDPPAEVIVVDDASTDGTEQILAGYGNRIRYVRSIQNNGVAITRNKGLDLAQGTHIAFLDADDTWHPDKLLVVRSVLEAKPDIFLLYHTYTLLPFRTGQVPETSTIYRIPFVKLLQQNTIATPCVVMRHTPTLRFEPTMRYMEDYDLWLRIAYRHQAYFINIALTKLGRPITAPGGLSAQKWNMRKGELRAFSRLRRLNPLFMLLLPALYTYSIGKHIVKKITGK